MLVSLALLALLALVAALLLCHSTTALILARNRRQSNAAHAPVALPADCVRPKGNWLVVICVVDEVELLEKSLAAALAAADGLAGVAVALDGRSGEQVQDARDVVRRVNAQHAHAGGLGIA